MANSNELQTVYDNNMSDVAFTGFSAINQNMFMALCARMKNRNDDVLTFTFDSLRKLLNYGETQSDTEFAKDLRVTNRKMLDLKCGWDTKKIMMDFVLFPTFKVDLEKKLLTVRVNPDFAYMLNNFNNFTSFEFKEFIGIESKYSKILYRKFKQYKSNGWYQVDIEEFRRIMCIPKAYTIKNLTQRVLKPCIEELSPIFKGLKCEPYFLRKQGKPLAGYKFTFVADQQIPGQMSFGDFIPTDSASRKEKQVIKDSEKKRTEEYGANLEKLAKERGFGNVEEMLLSN